MSAALRAEALAVLEPRAIDLIYEPILDDAAEEDTRHVRRDMTAPLIVCAGRLEPQKNFTLALRAFARIDPRLGARLLILGEGYERAELEKEAKWLAVDDRVTFGGHVPDIRPALADARLFLMSSRYEGYPAVLIEALAAGLPIVTTDCTPAMEEIMVHPSFGRVVGHDPEALAHAIEATFDALPPDAAATTALLARHRIDRAADDYLALVRSRLLVTGGAMPRLTDIWRCGIVHAPIERIVAAGSVAGLHIDWLPAGPTFTFLADPFGLRRGRRLFLFAEAYDYRTRIGRIDVLQFDAAYRLLDRRPALSMPWHLSYPVVFESEGDVWMLPEAHRSGALTLYRAVEFPHRGNRRR